jgi:hypothetical protein
MAIVPSTYTFAIPEHGSSYPIQLAPISLNVNITDESLSMASRVVTGAFELAALRFGLHSEFADSLSIGPFCYSYFLRFLIFANSLACTRPHNTIDPSMIENFVAPPLLNS